MRINVLNNLSNVVEKGTSKVQVGNKLMAGVPCSEVGRISEEGAIGQPLSSHSAPFGSRWKPAFNMHITPSTPSRFARLAAMVTLLLTLACGNVWGSVAVTWTASQTDFNNTFNSSTAATRLAGLDVGTGTRTFTVYTTAALANSNATPNMSWDNTHKFKVTDNNYKKAGIVIKLPTTCDDVDSIYFYVKTTNTRKIYYEANVSSVSTSNPSTTLTITSSFAGYKMGSTYTKGRYFGVGGRSGGSGDNAIQKVVVYFHESAACTAPDHVNVTGRWDRFAGETINLTATAYDGSDAEIAAANITGYQWQKLEGSTWTNVSNGTVSGATTTGATAKNLQITNCGAGNSGKYRCVVSTGATCSTPSATKTDGTEGFGVKVYVLECYNDGTKTCSFTRTGDTQAGTATLTLAANTAYTFKFHVDNTYYGNNASIHQDITNYVFCNSDNGGSCASNFTVNSGLGGTFTFGIEYSTGGNSSVEGEPELSVTYPRKTMYLVPNSDWISNSAKFAFYYYGTSGTGWTDFLSSNECGMSADIPQWNGLNVIAVRFNPSDATPGWNGDGHVWNQTGDITATADKNCVTITDWNTGTYGTYSTPTYTISYNAGTGGSGSKSNETKTCGVDFTLPSSAVFTRTGYTQTGWTTSDGAAQTHALGGSYTTNATQTFYPVWTVNNYTVTHTLDGVTKSSGATGANAATYGTNYTAVFAASSGYALPETITVTIGGSTKTAGTEYTWDQGTGTVVITGSYITGNIVITVNGESDSPCVIPSALTNEIARFQVPCDVDRSTTYNVTNEPYGSTNTYTTNSFGGSGNWYYNETTGLSYGKMTSSSGLTITIKLNTGNFQAGDVVYVYANRDQTGKQGVKVGSTNKVTIGVSSTAAGVEASGSYTLLSTDIEGDGTLKFYREGSNSFINRIIVTRPACTNVSITTQPTTPVAATVGSACSITGLVAAGTSPTYQWYTCNSDGSGATAITSAGAMSFTGYTSATLGLTPTAAGATYYKCVVSGSCGDPVTSNVVTVNASAAPASALITYNLNVGTSASTTLKSSTSTTDGTNITNIDIDQTNDGADGAGAAGGGSTTDEARSTKLAIKTGANGADWAGDPTNYEIFRFKVACGKKMTPSKIRMKVANVGSASADNIKYKAVLSDTYGHSLSGTYVVATQDGTVETFDIDNADASKYFQGEVTLKLWAWTIANKSNGGSAFRMGTPVEIYGAIGNQATPAATITWNTQPANGRVGDPDFAYDVTCSDGSAVTVTSANTTYATIVGGKLHYAAAGTTYLVASATDACGNAIVQNSNNFTVSVPATYDVTFSLTNVVYSSGDNQGTDAATEGTEFSTVFVGSTGYNLPSTITVTIDGDPATAGTDYTWDQGTGTLTIPGAKITGDITVSITGEEIPATKDIYYGHVKITDEALVREIPSGATQFFTNIGGTVANNTEISLSSTPSTTGMYYNSNNLTDAELSKSSNWGTSSGSNRYVRGLKFANGTTYTLALGTKVASVITFYGWCGSSSKTMTVGDEEFTSSSTKNTFAKHEFIKTGGFTGNVSITQDGDFYGILVITIQTATPCTTPVIPTLSNQSLCEGVDIAAWDATVTNASAISDAGETVTYSWKKKGNATELANTATFDLGASAAESQAGTYVVTVTVSKTGYASATATKEVTLTVNEATEVTGITADKATVYPTNSVTLTATANMDATWQWYTCTNAEGDGEAIIGGATNASYTIASAGAADTYYYKAKATGGCGTGSMVYTLTVSAAAGGDCFHYVSVLPAGNITVSSNTSLVTPTHATTLEGGTMKVGSSEMTITKDYGLKLESSKYVTVTLDAALEAGNVVIVKGTSGTKGYGITINGVNFYDADNKTFDVSYTVLADDGLVGKTSLNVTKYSGSSYLQEIKITGCGASCTDPEVTASADNTTACVSTSVTFTATGAHASATYQWQKLNGTWTNISDATASTYNIASVVAGDAGKYRVIASHECNRTSNEVTLSVPALPNFGSTVPASVSVMQTIALSINTVEATDAVKYRWYKSADATWDAGDTEIGTNKELIKAYDSEAIGSPSYYIFCRAQNACGTTTSSAIAVNVTTYVEEDCATRGNEGEAQFGFENTSMSSGTYDSKNVWYKNSNSAYLTYTAPTGKYFKTAKVTIASSNSSNASYQWSTDGSSWTAVTISGLTTTLTETEINLAAKGSGRVTHFRIGRNLDGAGESSGTFYLHKACFEYTEACTSTTVTPSTASVDYEMGDTWSNPTFSLSPAVGTLTYTSSNEDIASVDDDGTVTFNGEAGTVTITASYAGGTISATDYCASSGSYTINVSCPGGAPKVVADGSTDMSGCNSSVTLHAKTKDGTAFADGTYQWFRNGEEIDGATSSSYTATQAGIYTVERTNASGCTTPSTNSATVTSETTEPEVERLVPFQYYHVDKTYTDQMKMRHLFAVKNSGKLDGKSFKLYVSRNGGDPTDVTSSNALAIWPNADGRVDTVMVDLNKLSGKYAKGDELVYTCKAIDCESHVSETYKNTIQMHVIDRDTATLALICSGASGDGTRDTKKLVVGGDFLTGYNKADLCVQTGNTSFDKTQEWVLYTRLKENYIVTPVNGYAPFYKLNYEPFDILFLTDYPKASKSDAAATILDDMADLCDYRPLFTFKTHMVHKTPSKWAAKGFMATPEVPKQSRLRLNIVCYAHPMFDDLKEVSDQIQKDASDHSQIVYTMLTGPGHESSKGMQGFPIDAAEGFVTIGLVHNDATAADDTPSDGYVTWTPGSSDVMLVAAAERQVNLEARMILFSVNCGAQSKLTETGRQVVLKSLEYLLSDATITPVADCSFTFTNGAGNSMTYEQYKAKCPACTGTIGDGKWSTAGNWAPDWILQPSKDTEVKIAAPVTVDMPRARVRTVRIVEGGRIEIPAGSGLEVTSTIRHMDGTELSPTDVNDLKIGASSTGNGTLIFNNNTGDTKAGVAMYSKAFITDFELETEAKNYQYIGSPYVSANAAHNYYDSWLYYWTGTKWKVVKNGGPMTPWTGYCITQVAAGTTYWMDGTLTATGTVDIAVGAGQDMVVGNSWTAPLYIKAFTDDDFENLLGNVYFFNTGIEKDHTMTGHEAATRYQGSTYVTVPIHAASYTGDSLISSLQGFFVTSSGSAGTLHLDYDRHVRPAKNRNILSGEMHAPKRRTAIDTNEPEVVKIMASGENYDDRLVLLARADFSAGFDNGWDGDKWDGNEASLYIYSKDERGVENSVSAIPEMEGTVVGFRAGEDEAYTFTFEYLNSDEPLYLFDTENNSYTQIVTGGIYRFFTNDKEKHERFVLTRHAPQIATGCENLDGGEGAKAKKLLIEDKMFIMVNGLLYDATGKVVK